MNEIFKQHVESLHPAFERLMAMGPAKVHMLPKSIPDSGIYLFSEGDDHLYVGRTDRLRERLQEHCRKSSTHNSAPFAFILARKASGRLNATYRSGGSRAELEKEPLFGDQFAQAKDRVRRMDVRFVEEADPLRQTLLEMYAAIALQTPHNTFGNH